MIDYPPEVAKRVAFLDEYKENPKLNCFDILHLYPKGIAYPHGYWDSRFFEIVGFNSHKREKRNFKKNYDAIDFGDNCVISRAHVYADGAYLILLSHFAQVVRDTQTLYVTPCSA